MSDIDYVLALDPGKTTGWAGYNLLPDVEGRFICGQTDFSDTCGMVDAMTASWGDRLLVVSESFIINMATVKNTQAPWSLELIGVIRWFTMSRTHRDLVLQTPGTAKSFCSDDRLRRLGWWRKGEGHAMDAARHLCVLLATRRLFDDGVLLDLI